MRASPPSSSRNLFLFVLGGIACVFVVGRLLLSGSEPRERTEAAIVSFPHVEAAAPAPAPPIE